MIVLTSPSTNIGGDPEYVRPHLEDQKAPSEVAEDADCAREGIARGVGDKVVLHRRPRAKGLSPSPFEDDAFGKTAERRLLIQPGYRHTAAKLRASQRVLRQQPETAGDTPQHVLLYPLRQEQA